MNYSEIIVFLFYRKIYVYQFVNYTVGIALYSMYCRDSLYYYIFILPLVRYKYYFEVF